MAGAFCQSTMSSGGGMDVRLPAQDWEALLARPLAEARAELRIEGAAALGRALGRRAAAGRGVAGILLRDATFDRPGDSAVDRTRLPIVQQQRVKGAKSRCSGETSRGDRPRRPESVYEGRR